MFEIHSYLKIADASSWEELNQNPEKYFVVLKDDSELETTYGDIYENIEGAYGAIIIKYGDEILLNYTEYTIIHQFWENIIEMVDMFIKTGKATAGLPEDTAYISLEMINSNHLTFIRKLQFRSGQVDQREWIVPSNLFLKTLLEAGEEFCQTSKKYFYEEFGWLQQKLKEILGLLNIES